jgi:hypothetical protein
VAGTQHDFEEACVRAGTVCGTRGKSAEAEQELLRGTVRGVPGEWDTSLTCKTVEGFYKPHAALAELLEKRGTEEALTETLTLRDGVAQQLARHEATRAAALEETGAAAAEAVRQWREERSKTRQEKVRLRGSGKKRGRKGRPKAGGRRLLLWWLQLQRLSTRPQPGESQPPEEEQEGKEETREECAICP